MKGVLLCKSVRLYLHQMELMFVDFCLAKLWVIETPHIKELCLLFKIEEKEKTGLNSWVPVSDRMRYRI